MPLIAAHGLKKSYVERLLFENVSFEINENDRMGLVGVNGCGKTTLFRVLEGLERPDAGSVSVGKSVRIGTMAQTIPDTSKTAFEATLAVFGELTGLEAALLEIDKRLETAAVDELETLILKQHALTERYESLGGLTFRSRTRSALMGLGFSEKELDKPLSEMSGGQRNKAQLASVLLSGAEVLLLDEPTNHLDMEALNYLEEFLLGYCGAFIVISHDRYFLDRVTTRTMELKNTRLFLSNGNYSRHVELMSNDQEALRRKYENTKKEIRRIERIVEQQRRFGRERNFITAASKLKQADRLRATLVAPERDTDRIRFRFDAQDGTGNDVLIAEGLEKAYEKPVFRDVSLHVRSGERVFLLGPNGCGKTTLLRILTGREHPDAGSVSLGARVQPGYYEQHTGYSNAENTMVEEISDAYPRMDTGEIRSALAAFLFRGDDVAKRMGLLSGGELARIQLLKLMLSGANFLLLDEPTNHLDIASREALERALEDYEGTMIVVTHDRYLVERLADRILYMQDRGLAEYIGGYEDFLLARAKRAAAIRQTQAADGAEPQNDYRAKKERESAVNRARGEVRRAEERIAAAEAELKELEALSAEPDVASDYVRATELAKRMEEKRSAIAELYLRWEETLRAFDALAGA